MKETIYIYILGRASQSALMEYIINSLMYTSAEQIFIGIYRLHVSTC